MVAKKHQLIRPILQNKLLEMDCGELSALWTRTHLVSIGVEQAVMNVIGTDLQISPNVPRTRKWDDRKSMKVCPVIHWDSSSDGSEGTTATGPAMLGDGLVVQVNTGVKWRVPSL